jgi:hypothetical protein
MSRACGAVHAVDAAQPQALGLDDRPQALDERRGDRKVCWRWQESRDRPNRPEQPPLSRCRLVFLAASDDGQA